MQSKLTNLFRDDGGGTELLGLLALLSPIIICFGTDIFARMIGP